MTTRPANLHPERGLLRLALRLPIWLYRARLGWLLGDRFLLLTHIGRKSGLPRQAALEVVRHDRATDTYIIASGWGEKADWYRNIRHTPAVTIASGGRRWAAWAEPLSKDTAEREFRHGDRRVGEYPPLCRREAVGADSGVLKRSPL
jgi:deazaflavin-dependent oxidoreductase (nitroreductase family)